MSSFQSAKIFLAEVTNLGKDALHIYVGLIVMLAVAVAFKKSLRDWRPLAAVALASVAGEIWDVIDTYSHGGTPKWNANWKDIWNTMFWPTALFLLARFTKVLKR
jgi:cell shape-determining protein MreD